MSHDGAAPLEPPVEAIEFNVDDPEDAWATLGDVIAHLSESDPGTCTTVLCITAELFSRHPEQMYRFYHAALDHGFPQLPEEPLAGLSDLVVRLTERDVYLPSPRRPRGDV